MVGDDICTGVSQTKGYGEQIPLFKSRLIAGGAIGAPVLLPTIATVPRDGMAALPGGTWTAVQWGLQPWCNSLLASIPGATHQLPGLW